MSIRARICDFCQVELNDRIWAGGATFFVTKLEDVGKNNSYDFCVDCARKILELKQGKGR